MDTAEGVYIQVVAASGALWKKSQAALDRLRARGAWSGCPDTVEVGGLVCNRFRAKVILALCVLGTLLLRGVYLSSLAGSSSSLQVPTPVTHDGNQASRSTGATAKVEKKLLKTNVEVSSSTSTLYLRCACYPTLNLQNQHTNALAKPAIPTTQQQIKHCDMYFVLFEPVEC